MTKVNIDVKLEAISKGVNLYELPAQLKMCSTKFYKMLRTPLSEQDKQRILNAINEIADNR